MPMTIEVEQLDGPSPIAIIALAGELDASNYERLIATVQQTWDAGAKGLVLDLTDLTFMASSGLVALYSAARVFRGEGAPDVEAGWQVFHDMQNDSSGVTNVRLAGTQQAVQRVLERTGLSRLFAIDATAEIAVAALQGA
jgi:anti-anti-sigma factor